MESPVRICLGAALVVCLLLLSSTTAQGSAIDATTTRDDRAARYAKINGTTWVSRGKPKTPDVALNELAKESVSEEHTDKNAKYKDRGRVRFGSQSSTAPPRRKIKVSSSTTEGPKLMIITPEPEKKNMTQIIDSMRTYKKNKMPVLASSSTTPVTVIKKEIATHEEYEDEEEEEENENFEKYTSNKFHENSNFFTIPGFGDDDDDSAKEGTENKVHRDFSVPSYEKFSTFYPKEISYSPNSNDEPYKSDSFFHNFDSELTTPKNDFFDKKFKEISSSIIKNLDSIKAKTPAPNKTNVHKILKENVDVEKFNKGSPTNKSTVIIKNTKEIRLLDNEGANTDNQELSDVHGTSIYYEMSVVSTETYAIDNSNDDDCDKDTSPYDPTPSTSEAEELGTVKATLPSVLTTLPTLLSSEASVEASDQKSTKLPTISSSASTLWSQNSILSTEETATSTKSLSSSYVRNRSYSKRLNFTGTKEPNKITPNTDQVGSNQVYRPVTRKFLYTTPKTKPVWMAPRRNVTRNYQRTTFPTTIYSEHFNIKDKFTTTPKPQTPTRTVFTTVSSDIDPVLQTEIGGVKKVVHSQSISDNSIPTLWKRGSTKFASSTVTSTETETEDTSDLEIPPTFAWALASLRSPPSSAPAANRTTSTQKSVDENELQKLGEVTEKKDMSTMASSGSSLSTTTIPNAVSSKPDHLPEVEENKLAWRPISAPITTPTPETKKKLTETTTESKVERLPAESNISEQSSVEQITTEVPTIQTYRPDVSAAELIGLTKPPPWVAVSSNNFGMHFTDLPKQNDTLKPVNTTKSTFASITKLPSDVTTPESDTIINQTKKDKELFSDANTATVLTTTDYEITTRRFNYIPTTTEEIETTETDLATTDTWHPVMPTKTNIVTEEPVTITTYRPKLYTTTEYMEETTTEMASSVVELQEHKTTFKPLESSTTTTEVSKEEKTSVTFESTEQTTSPPIEETSTIIVEIATEISSERETKGSQFTTKSSSESTEFSTELPSSEKESVSEENSGSNEVITLETPKTTAPITSTVEVITKSEQSEVDTTTLIDFTTQQEMKETTTEQNSKPEITTMKDNVVESTTEYLSTKSVNELEDLSTYNGEVTTESSSRVLTTEETGSGAAIAIAVSTIGVIALILLVGLLLVVRRRGRRGVYAQRCTPVSLDAYSLDSVSVGHRKGNHRLRASKRSYGNPAYDDEVTSHPMQYAALANFAMDIDSMTTEFAEIPSVSVRPDEVPPGCEDKNRYSNVLPLPETRVPLQRLGSDPTSEYINANFVTGPGNIKNYYIACQAPLPNTVADMWRMMWEQNSRLIIMLTEYMENGVEKSYEYLPSSEISDNKRTFGDFQVILKKREQRDKYAISFVQLINLRTRTWREVTHMWYFWPAKGVPDDYDSVIDFLSEMRGYMKVSQTAKEYDEEGVEVIYGDSRSSFNNLSKLRSEDGGVNGHGVSVYSPQKAEELQRRANAVNGTLGRMKAASEVEGVRPCVVTCASGAGRSAALITLDVCARALAAGAADVPRVVRELRAQRPHSLANRHHYIFVYKVLSEYGNKLMGGGVDTI